ncbi:MAG: hypothetical protein JW782_00325, partial [Candidatus Saganbacteria bacterium]|nr:hypothetical protein [Candidatus Saganbacteria bacterium]
MKKLLTLFTILILTGGIALAQTGTIPDPMSIGVGARALGLGRAYVGMAEDSDALFMNPAGIARAGNPKLSSMYSSLMGDVTYTVVGGVYPYGERSAVGAGIINAHTADINLTNTDGSLAGDGSWGDTVMFLSGGTYLNNIPAFRNIDRDILIGGSFKYFSVGGSGSNDVADLSDASGTGYSADLGLLYPATDYLTLGVNYQNVLASKLTRANGVNENIPANLKLGAKVALIGSQDQAYTTHSMRRLFLNADYDMNALDPKDASHLGLEFWPVGNLALRAGVDGDNLTGGLGVRLAGFEFNYAYHPFDGINDNATSFFSITYLGESLKRELRVHIDQPTDKTIIYEDHVQISGRVEVIPGDGSEPPMGPLTVKVNGTTVAVTEDNTFTAQVPIESIGKKRMLIEA